MYYIIVAVVCLVVGFGVGFLCYRNNSKKMADAEKSVVDVASKFKRGE